MKPGLKPGLHEPAACFPSKPQRLCEHCARCHLGGHLHEPDRRFSVVIDASVLRRRPGDLCGMFEFPPTFEVRRVS